MIKTVFFDIGGVLLEIDPQRTARYWSQHSGVPVEQIEAAFPYEAHHDYERGLMNNHDFFKSVKAALPQPNKLNEHDFWEGWRLLVGAQTGAVDLLTQLASQIPVWLLSNTNPRHILEDVSPRFQFFSQVAGAIYSYEVGSRKPEPGIFTTALKQAGCLATESLFIDDVKQNIDQAQTLGFKTVHFTDAETLKARMIQLGLPVA